MSKKDASKKHSVHYSAPFPSCLIVLDKYLTTAKINYLKSLGLVMKNL
ncbi:hypothetical protein [Salmonella phage SD-1_S14]|nr:hypothetical protein [Salmonella phage SD-1_S14]